MYMVEGAIDKRQALERIRLDKDYVGGERPQRGTYRLGAVGLHQIEGNDAGAGELRSHLDCPATGAAADIENRLWALETRLMIASQHSTYQIVLKVEKLVRASILGSDVGGP